ncbi:U3 small nucleolar RNA-associated protein 14 homolog A [Lepeophtheirus salmonis]|uniref:U3 small nucleolar RNA-associated protein 14 homolog A n=1 Tax=Lepeophtheirus salmonis TaxID=72036 RepID=UPI001AE8A533|nr:U3 small nucleolar RNA-associated protein 14 homolog A-like [Lepeophtheirus salmonis]
MAVNKKNTKKHKKPKKLMKTKPLEINPLDKEMEEIDFSAVPDDKEDIEGNYDGFMEGMASLEGSKRFLHQTQADGEEEEDNFNYGVSQTSIDSLLGAVTDKKTKKSIRKSFSDQVEKHTDLKLKKVISTPEQDKVDRKATYQRTQEELAQWDAVVHSRRNALSLNFPLVKPDLKLITSASHYQSKFEAKTPLEAEVMSLLNGSSAVLKPDQELSEREKSLLDKMTMREALLKRQELMKLKSLQSYQEQKVRRQNKIKSKKYRKILRKEKQKDKVRELELLHASNPELAAEKLEEMEKIRIQERATLKHRNASKYLQAQAIRSKSNAESREIVQEQLRKHRELTNKLVTVDSEDDEDQETSDPVLHNAESSDNPWIQSNVPADKNKDVNEEGETFDEFSANYKEYWTTLNEQKGEKEISNVGNLEIIEEVNGTQSKSKGKNLKRKMDETVGTETEPNNTKKEKSDDTTVIGGESDSTKTKNTKRKRNQASQEEMISPQKNKISKGSPETSSTSLAEEEERKLMEKKQSIIERERLEMTESIDDLFCEAELLVQEKLQKKIKKLSSENCNDDTQEDFEMEKETDENLVHADSLNFETDQDHNKKLKKATPSKKSKNIDPSNFIKVKKNVKQTQIKDKAMECLDEDEEEGIRKVIAEAFADDDVIEKDFKAEKNAIIESNKPKTVDLVLPGWGSWGGQNIKVSKKKIKRFTFKAPPTPVRKDANKGHLILNEDKNDAIRKHQVSSVPFPFRSVKDYEASIRTPVGETFVPRTVFKKLIKPKTKTCAGVIIEPMDKEELVKRGLLKDACQIET